MLGILREPRGKERMGLLCLAQLPPEIFNIVMLHLFVDNNGCLELFWLDMVMRMRRELFPYQYAEHCVEHYNRMKRLMWGTARVLVCVSRTNQWPQAFDREYLQYLRGLIALVDEEQEGSFDLPLHEEVEDSGHIVSQEHRLMNAPFGRLFGWYKGCLDKNWRSVMSTTDAASRASPFCLFDIEDTILQDDYYLLDRVGVYGPDCTEEMAGARLYVFRISPEHFSADMPYYIYSYVLMPIYADEADNELVGEIEAAVLSRIRCEKVNMQVQVVEFGKWRDPSASNDDGAEAEAAAKVDGEAGLGNGMVMEDDDEFRCAHLSIKYCRCDECVTDGEREQGVRRPVWQRGYTGDYWLTLQ